MRQAGGDDVSSSRRGKLRRVPRPITSPLRWRSIIVVLAAASLAAPPSVAAPSPVFVESSAVLGAAESTAELWGVAAVDWDQDGCDDLYVGHHGASYPRLYRNGCPGALVEETPRLGLTGLDWRETHDRHTMTFADYDGDGRMDLFITTGAGAGEGDNDDQLLHQLPDGTFGNVAPSFGIQDRYGSGRLGLWFDADRDGDLDLFLGHFLWSQRIVENSNILWRNDGTGFVNVAAAAGIGTAESSTSSALTDVNGDGLMDLITSPGTKTSLYVNRGNGTFTRQGLGYSATASVAPGDYDGDGRPDLFLCRGGKRVKESTSVLLHNDGGTWRNVTTTAGVAYSYCLTALWIDIDNDGDLDLFATRNIDGSGVNQPNVLLLNNGNGTFADVAAVAGVQGPSDGQLDSAAWGDFNQDGFVDLAVLSSLSATGVLVYLNQGNGNGWITLHPEDPSSPNRLAIGAKLWVTTDGVTQYREINGAMSYRSQSALYAHVGLGAATIVSAVRIRWPDGGEETFNNIAINRHYRLVRGTGPLGMAVARRRY